MNNVSAEYLAAAQASDQRSAVSFQIWTSPSATTVPALIRDITEYVTTATWEEDETASPRSTCTVTLESLGAPLDDLVPEVDGDLLHPLTGNELRIFAGFTYLVDGEEVTELAPCGVYRMTKPQVADDGTKVEIAITGNDRSAAIEVRAWTVPYEITGSPTTDVAIQALLDDRMPGLTYNLEPTTFQVPPTTLGTQGGSSSGGPFSDAVALAVAAGQELFFDAQGVVITRTIPDPTTTPVQLSFVEGENCTVTTLTRVLDETQTYNGVVCTSSTAGTAFPVSATVWVTDPNSPINPTTTDFGYVPYFYTTTLVETYDQALAAATSMLQTLLTAFDDLSFTATANPALRAGDCMQFTRTRAGVSDTYAASQITFNYSASSASGQQPMSVTNRARRTAA